MSEVVNFPPRGEHPAPANLPAPVDPFAALLQVGADQNEVIAKLLTECVRMKAEAAALGAHAEEQTAAITALTAELARVPSPGRFRAGFVLGCTVATLIWWIL